MNIKIRCLAGLLALSMMLFSACGKPEEPKPGSRSNPLLPGEAITFNGMNSNSDWAEYVVDITYLDAIRGEEAMDIFLAGGYYVTTEMVPEGQELIIVKMTLHVQETKDDSPVLLGDDGTPFFQAVSGNGVSYEHFVERAYLNQNLFTNMYAGGEQTAHRFFLVDKDDPNPLMVIHPEINGGLWFKLTIDDDQRTDRRIDIAEWSHSDILPNNSDFERFKVTGDFAGTLRAPLPLGHWGLYRGDEYSLNQILEIMMEKVEHGDMAAQRLLSTSTWQNAKLTDSQEIMAVLLNINVLHTQDDVGVDFFDHNFEMLKPDGQAVNVIMPLHNSLDALPTAFPGASYSGWVFFIVEKDDKNLLLSPSSYSPSRLWMSTDPETAFPEGKDEYIPQYNPSIGGQDPGAQVGTMRNPTPAGTVGSLAVDAFLNPFEVEIKVLEMERGDSVKDYLTSTKRSYIDKDIPDGYELASIMMDICVTKSKDDQPVNFDYYFNLITDDHILCRDKLSSIDYENSFSNLYPEAPVTGRVIFIVDKNSQELLLRFSETLYVPAIWFELPEPVTSPSRIPSDDKDENASPPKKLTKSFTDEQLRGLAFGAVLATRNDLGYEYLSGFSDDNIFHSFYTERHRTTLTRDWGIKNHDEAAAMMDRLVDGLHHRASDGHVGYDYIFSIATGKQTATDQEKKLYSDKIAACEVVTRELTAHYGYTKDELKQITTVSAWDYDRLVAVSRMCYAVGWLSENEVWGYIAKAAKAGSDDYGDWRGYFAGVMYGRAIWSGDTSFSTDNARIANELLNSSESIYNRILFKPGQQI